MRRRKRPRVTRGFYSCWAYPAARLARYDRAEEAFSSALALQPGDFDILVNLGRAAARAQHFERAQRALETALKIRPADIAVLTELGTVCMSREDYARAVFVLAQARKQAPGNPQILRMLARAAEDAGYHEDAVTAYDEYLRLRPDDDVARRDRARACGYTETRQEEARKELTWYLGKHPNDAEAHYIFAQVFWWPEPEGSLQHLTEAVRLDPKSVQIRFSRAWMLQRVGKMSESLPDLDVANREAPDNVRILDLIGLARLALDQPAEAEKVLRRAAAKAPEDPEVVLHLGRALMASGHDTEAQTYLEKYRTIRRPGLQRLRQRPGMFELATLSAAKQRELEIERFRSAAREHPDHPDYQLHLARMLLADGQRDAALQEFRTLLAMNANSHIREDAGTLLLSAGEYAPAREFLERAAEERPSARLDLAIAVFQADGPGPALEVLDKVPAGELSADTLLLKADLLEAAGRRAEAEKALDRWAGQASARPRVVMRAIPLLVRLNRKDAALTLLEQAIRTNPQDPDLPLTKAVVEGLTDRYPAAEKTLRDVEQRLPEWDRAYFAHGLLLERAGRLGEARQKFQTASALGSRDPGLSCALARLARDGGGGAGMCVPGRAGAIAVRRVQALMRRLCASCACLPRLRRRRSVPISRTSLRARSSPTSPTTTSEAGSTFSSRCAAGSPLSITTTTAGWTSTSRTAPKYPEMKKDPSFYNCLLRNQGDGTFEDVTAAAGLTGSQSGFNYGVAAGDYDNDGNTDLFVAARRRTFSTTTRATGPSPMSPTGPASE